MDKIGQSGGFLGKVLGPFLNPGLPAIGNALKRSAESVLLPLGLTAVASATEAGIQKKMFGTSFGTLIISNEEKIYIKWNQVNFLITEKTAKRIGLVGRQNKNNVTWFLGLVFF